MTITFQHGSYWRLKMKSKYLAAALLGSALLTGAAYAAETATTDRSNINTAVHKEGQWRASQLITGPQVKKDRAKARGTPPRRRPGGGLLSFLPVRGRAGSFSF